VGAEDGITEVAMTILSGIESIWVSFLRDLAVCVAVVDGLGGQSTRVSAGHRFDSERSKKMSRIFLDAGRWPFVSFSPDGSNVCSG